MKVPFNCGLSSHSLSSLCPAVSNQYLLHVSPVKAACFIVSLREEATSTPGAQQEEDLNLEEVDLYANMLQNPETHHPQVQQ